MHMKHLSQHVLPEAEQAEWRRLLNTAINPTRRTYHSSAPPSAHRALGMMWFLQGCRLSWPYIPFQGREDQILHSNLSEVLHDFDSPHFKGLETSKGRWLAGRCSSHSGKPHPLRRCESRCLKSGTSKSPSAF